MGFPKLNFGRNHVVSPTRVVAAVDEQGVVEAVRDCRGRNERLRAIGSLHSWSGIVDVSDVLIDVSRLQEISISNLGAETVVKAGAGASIADILATLEPLDLTLPTVGAITKQRVAGAVATATHGSGKPSLSHYVRSIRIACIDPDTGEPGIVEFSANRDSGEFDAARVSLGYMGIVTSITLACVPQYEVEESLLLTNSLKEDILNEIDNHPLMQFALIPYDWRFYVFRRHARHPSEKTFHDRVRTFLYRRYKICFVDRFLHFLVKSMAYMSRGWFIQKFFDVLFPPFALRNKTFVDRSDRALTLRHDLYRHMEMEVFVPLRHIEPALDIIRHLTAVFARGGPSPDELPEDTRQLLSTLPGMLETLRARRGSFTYHYVINCRLVHAEDALIAMTAGSEPYVSISFFTYRAGQDDRFYEFCRVMAECLVGLFQARLHWGKIFPLQYENSVERTYESNRLEAFRETCRRFDPDGMFRNEFARTVLGFDD